VADMPYPYYRLQADGPSETGMVLLFQVQTSGAGPLPGRTEEDLLAHLKAYFAGDSGDATVRLSSFSVATTNNL
jgi:hypothetical protein